MERSVWRSAYLPIRADLFLPEKEESFEVGSGTHVYEYDTNTSLKELKFTLDSTLGERFWTNLLA